MKLHRSPKPPLAESSTDFFNAMMRPHRRALLSLIVFSCIINVMALATSLYTMQIYDRVLTSQSMDTLGFLTLAVVMALGLSAILEFVRQSAASSIARWICEKLGPVLLRKSIEQRLIMPTSRLEALRDLATVKNFISTPTLFSIIDVLWMPMYAVIVFMLHPALGGVALLGVAVLLVLAWLNERGSTRRIRDSQSKTTANLQYAESLVRNSEVIDAMGMADATVAHWSGKYSAELAASDRTQKFSVRVSTAARFVRYLIQIALLGVGAVLVLQRDLTGGAMIAGSILMARLLAPIESSIAYWKQFVMARQALQRIDTFCTIPEPRPSQMTLPKPSGDIHALGVNYVPPGLASPVLRGVTFHLPAGQMLALAGPSASGKTTLSRLIVGTIKPTQGHVRLDNADVFDWARSDFGPNIGYLPQDVELLPGTIRDNIARFQKDASNAEVVAAARMADCHDMILRLDGGYEMMLTEGGLQLSGGQRQRIGLARALFGSPRLVVLDEPNASLDTAGEAALLSALRELRSRKVTTIVVSHRANLLRLADRILLLANGQVANFGLAREVLAQLEAGKTTGSPAGPAHRPAVAPPNSGSARPASIS
jgi:ATP-binding cassette subfamily C exporter for protease/lipase